MKVLCKASYPFYWETKAWTTLEERLVGEEALRQGKQVLLECMGIHIRELLGFSGHYVSVFQCIVGVHTR